MATKTAPRGKSISKGRQTVRIGGRDFNESKYRPSNKEQEMIQYIRRDFTYGKEIMEQPYEEFNNQDVVDRMNRLQRQFNSYQPPKSQDPDDAWKSNAKRPIIRNKVISIAAHITSSLLYPNVFAQNDKQEEDKAAALVAKDLMSWAGDQSKYEQNILYAIIAMLVNPCAIMETGYREVYRKVKVLQDDGTYKTEEIEDEDYSGFYDEIVPVDELYIGNIYEHDIQKQPYLIRRKVVDYESAARMYEKEYPNFKYVSPGLRITFSEENDTFYEQYDEDLQERLVEIVTYYNKLEDLELLVCNGVLLSKTDQPMTRKDKDYPFAKGIYSLIDEGKFFYGKSLVDEMLNDAEVVDTLYQMIIDGTYLEVMPYAIAYGAEEFHASIVAPGKITGLDKDSKVEMGNIKHNLGAGMNMLEKVEGSISESSSGPLSSGQGAAGNQTAYEISRLEQNAMTVLGLFGKMIGFFVRDYGKLRLDDILQYMTVGEVGKISGNKLTYKTFNLGDQNVKGKNKTKRLEFTTDDFPAEGMTEMDEINKSIDLMEQEEKMNNDTEIYKINPNIFRNLKYIVRVDATFMPIKNEAVKKALNLEAYDRAIQNPLADQEAVFKDFLLENYVPGESDKYIKEEQAMQEQAEGQQGGFNSLKDDILGGTKNEAKKELGIEKQV